MRLVIMGQDLQRGIVENKVARSRLDKPFRRCDGEGFPEVAFSSVVVGGGNIELRRLGWRSSY